MKLGLPKMKGSQVSYEYIAMGLHQNRESGFGDPSYRKIECPYFNAFRS